ncbi:MAG: polyphosphate kinase 1 [Actinobacteria bacterium]|nr:polyphosphate kinase 1 [Actinomycetota bacterium]
MSSIESFGAERFSSRELSRLEFAARLLDLADDSSLPLLERSKFVAIYAEMLDEFFQVRVVSLEDKIAAGIVTPSLDGLRPLDQFRAVRERVLTLTDRLETIVTGSIFPELAAAGIEVVAYSSLDEAMQASLREYFLKNVHPVLTPLAVDPVHPFPQISNLSLNIAVAVTDPVTHEERAARIKVPGSLPRFIPLVGGRQWCMIEEIIIGNLDVLFPGMEIGHADLFRVTRNADLALEDDEADDLLVAVELELRRRRFGKALRVEIHRAMSPEFLALLVEQLELEADRVYVTDTPLGLGDLWQLCSLPRPDLQLPRWSPVTPRRLVSEGEVRNIFEVIREGNLLLHHPYESFADSIEEFIEQAASDPDVVGIKQTLYRTSGDSPIVASLIKAAGSGKQVVALVELKARFDEAANIQWAKSLEDAGVHVVYGVMGLKTHSKTALVLRREDQEIRRYAHVGTGNYNSKTARIYEDFSLLTDDEAITHDIGELFNFLTGFSHHVPYRKLVVSPVAAKSTIIGLIDSQASLGTRGLITIKVNGLTDPAVIDALYRASAAGTRVSLIVRTLCSLRPGVAGLSENIVIKSVVGEFLEHSRVFVFGHPRSADSVLLIGSADLMERNLERRIEVLVPIEDALLREPIIDAIERTLADDTNSWLLGSDRRWRRIVSVDQRSVHSELRARALEMNR